MLASVVWLKQEREELEVAKEGPDWRLINLHVTMHRS